MSFRWSRRRKQQPEYRGLDPFPLIFPDPPDRPKPYDWAAEGDYPVIKVNTEGMKVTITQIHRRRAGKLRDLSGDDDMPEAG